MKYFFVVQVLFVICFANVSISLDVEGNSPSNREIEQPLQQHEQDSEQLAPQELHQSPSTEYSSYRKSATLPSYWLPLLYHLKQKRQQESNSMQQFVSDGNLYDASDLTDGILSSSGVTGVRASEDDLLDRLSLAESNDPSYNGVSNRQYSGMSVSMPRYPKWRRIGRQTYARQSRKPDAGKLSPFASGNQNVISFIQDVFGSKDGRGVRFGLS